MTPDDDPGAFFDAMIPAVDRATQVAVGRTGATLHTQVRANAKTGTHAPGRPHIPGTGPGPNTASGDYLRSISLTTGRDMAGAFAIVATNAVQARRLEYGFVGIDALGRSYRQAPYPHWRPAIAVVPEIFARELDRALSASGRTA